MSTEPILGSPCPPWCAEHREQDLDDHGAHLVRHLRFLTALRGELDNGAASAWVKLEQMTVTGAGAMSGTSTACLSFDMRYESTSRPFTPAEAREVAAALLAGAEAIEAMETSSCVDCGCGLQPRESEDDGQRCGRCSHTRWKDRRSHLAAVPVKVEVTRGTSTRR